MDYSFVFTRFYSCVMKRKQNKTNDWISLRSQNCFSFHLKCTLQFSKEIKNLRTIVTVTNITIRINGVTKILDKKRIFYQFTVKEDSRWKTNKTFSRIFVFARWNGDVDGCQMTSSTCKNKTRQMTKIFNWNRGAQVPRSMILSLWVSAFSQNQPNGVDVNSIVMFQITKRNPKEKLCLDFGNFAKFPIKFLIARKLDRKILID